MDKFSQQAAPLLSNPATNPFDEIPLNGDGDGVDPDEMKSLLNRVINQDYKQDPALVVELQDSLLKIQNDQVKKKIETLINAVNMGSNPRKKTKNIDRIYPENQYDPTPEKIAQDIIKIISSLFPAEPKMTTPSTYNNKTAQKVIKKKKKTRGNPFRVLMGKVGKLLDHGVEKNDIVRYIAKENKWDNETIEKAVKIVQDYNRKKSRKAENQNKVVTSAYDYTVKPDFEKRSTPELVFRVCYLLELQDYDKNTKQGHGKDAANKKGAKEEISEIKTALINRGFDKADLDKLGLGN